MTIVQAGKILVVVALLSVGQIFFKIAALQMKAGSMRDALLGLALNPYMIIALAIYGIATVLWVTVLREVPLSRAYPLTILGMFIVPGIGLLVFKEPITWSLFAGGALMVAGGYIIALR